MTHEETSYRLKLAEGFLGEARQNLQYGLWRSCVDNSQLATENAAKAVLALLGPVGSTHEPGALLLRALDQQRFTEAIADTVRQIALYAKTLGSHVHIRSDYGDEAARRTPWEIFDQASAEQALAIAEGTLALAMPMVEAWLR